MSLLKSVFIFAAYCFFQATLYSQADINTVQTEPDTETIESSFPEWKYTSGYYEFRGLDGSNVPDAGPPISTYKRDRVEILLASGEVIFFNCITAQASEPVSDFSAAINLDVSKEVTNNRLRSKRVSGRLIIGNRSKLYRWKWNPDNMIIEPIQEEAARRLFNGVIKQEKVSLKIFGDDRLGIVLPTQNADFIDFYEACTILSGNQ